MNGPTLAEYFQAAGIQRYPAFAPFVRLDKKPFGSQVTGLSLCAHYQWYGLLDQTGAGKSLPAVATALHYIGLGNKVLVVTLASLTVQFAESVYEDFVGVDKYVRVHILDEEPAKRTKLIAKWQAENSWPEMMVMSYEMFAVRKMDMVMKAAGYDVLITDESQKWKTPGKVFAMHVENYVGDPENPETAFIPMTGTPMHTCMTDCYMLVKLLSPGHYGSYDEFMATHCVYKTFKLKEPRITKRGQIQRYFTALDGYTKHDELSVILYQRARRVLKREIPELVELKTPIITEVPVKLSTPHLTLYRKLLAERFLELEGNEVITALQEQDLRMKSLQIVTCPEAFIPESQTIENHVVQTIHDLIDNAAGETKVILFLHFRDTVERYAKCFAKWKPALIYGGVDANGREKSRQRFLFDDECRLLIANPKSAGAGFNFQSVSYTTIFGEPMASPGDFTQAMDRVDRPGQRYQCNTYVIKALSTIAPHAIKEMLRRDTDISQVTRDPTTLRHLYNFA